MTKTEYTTDFFITYSKADEKWAEWIAWELEQEGFRIVFQKWDFIPGQNFVLEMQKASANSIRTLAILSQDFVESLYTQPEWASAFAGDPMGVDCKLIPVRVQPCKLEGLLRQIIYVDLLDRSEDDARIALLEGIKGIRKKPDCRPSFPEPKNIDRNKLLDAKSHSSHETLNREMFQNRHDGRLYLQTRFKDLLFLILKLNTPFTPNGFHHGGHLLLIDVDNMTGINKKYGTSLGNEILETIYMLLGQDERICKGGRCGDDTFFVIFLDTTDSEVEEWSSKFLAEVCCYEWEQLANKLYVTCCIGIAHFYHRFNPNDILCRAGLGFEKAKKVGTSQYAQGPSYLEKNHTDDWTECVT